MNLEQREAEIPFSCENCEISLALLWYIEILILKYFWKKSEYETIVN